MADEDVRQFEAWDWVLFAAMLAISVGIGIFHALKDLCGKKPITTGEFLVGGRNMQLLPVAVSILVSFVSAITILGMPAETYTAGTSYFMYLFGRILATVLTSLLFVPLLYPLALTSSFEYLELRFKSRLAKLTGTVIMIVQQIMYMGVAIFAPSTALEAVTGFPTLATIITVGCVSTFYTFLGGMKAVVWTQVFQSFIIFAGLLAVLIQGIIKTGGLGKVWSINDKWGRIDFWEPDTDPSVRHSIWSLVVGGTVGWLALFGINQATVQRYSALPTLMKSRQAVLLNILGATIVMTVTCLAGIVVFAYYAQKGCDPLTSKKVSNPNQLIPYFVMEVLDYPGLPGLFISCLFSGALSTTSSFLNALSAVTWADIFKPLIGHKVTETTKTWITKLLVALYGAAGVGFACLSQNLGGTVLQVLQSFIGAASGPLLGLFLLGGLFPWANAVGCVIGGVLGLALPLWICVGAYNLPASGYTLDFPTYNCTLKEAVEMDTVSTTLAPSTTPTALSGIELLFTVSYLWYPSIGAATAVIVGLLVSVPTARCFPQEEIDPKYIIPLFDRLFCCLPERWRKPCRCGHEYQDPPDIQLDMDQEIVVENGVIYGLTTPDHQTKTPFKTKVKSPFPDGVSVITYKQSNTLHFVYDNATVHPDNDNIPFDRPLDSEIPPKYD